MRMKLLAVLAAVLLPSLALAGTPVSPEGVTYQTADVVEITDAVSGGTDAAVVKRGRYEVCAFDEDVYVCEAATCATGGVRISDGACTWWLVPASATFSARSTASGDVQFRPYR